MQHLLPELHCPCLLIDSPTISLQFLLLLLLPPVLSHCHPLHCTAHSPAAAALPAAARVAPLPDGQGPARCCREGAGAHRQGQRQASACRTAGELLSAGIPPWGIFLGAGPRSLSAIRVYWAMLRPWVRVRVSPNLGPLADSGLSCRVLPPTTDPDATRHAALFSCC